MSTTFPNATQSFKHWEDLTQEQLTAYVNYINALNQGQWSQARQIFQNSNLSDAMLPTAKDFNDMCDTILECKALYEAPTTSAKGIQDFMNQFAYKGEFSASNISQYKKFALVKYMGTLYIAITDVTSTATPPLNNTQWLGIHTVSATNSATLYRGDWSSSTNYNIGDAVFADNIMYLAIKDNVGSKPNPTNDDWEVIIDFNPFMARLFNTQPTNMQDKTIWFKEL